MAAASAFSYAQAAKGQGPVKTTVTATASETSQNTAATESISTEKSGDIATSVGTLDTTPEVASHSVTHEKQDLESVSAIESEVRTELVTDRSPGQRRDDDTRRLDRPWRRNDKGTRSSSVTTRSVDEQETRRPRKGKKGKNSEKHNGDSSAVVAEDESKAVEDAPKIELSEAPIPSVNIWQQRKEAQQAKAKPSEATTQHEAEPTVPKPPVASSVSISEATAAPTVPVNGTKLSQKASEAIKPERQASRGHRNAARESKSEAPPMVNDASSWPTPEIAIKEDKRKPSEKGERSDKDMQDETKPRQKKEWVAYEYVPSVSFETQMPQIRGSKARGGAKGTATARSSPNTASNQSSEKTNTVSISAKTTDGKERVRESHQSGNGANNAAPTPAKRAPVDTAQTQTRSEQKKPVAPVGTDKSKEIPSGNYPEHGPTQREGRSERGRGGYRGRGNHHGVHPQIQHQHQHNATTMPGHSYAPQAPTGARSQGPYSPPPRQGAHGQPFISSNQRGGRGGRNNGANYHRMSLPNGSARIPPVDTQYPAYNYPAGPMSAVPYPQVPLWDNMMVSMLRNQIEYYFSIENLCKDMYLRKRMDSQGFVPLLFVTAFKRMRELAPDMSIVRHVCEESNEIDFVLGDDDVERLRRRQGWDSFVLPMSDRDELARNDGPLQFTFKNRPYGYATHFNGMGFQGVTSPPVFHPQSFVDDHQLTNGVNGLHLGHGGTQLSAAVPDFSPSHPIGEQAFGTAPSEGMNGQSHVSGTNGLPNGTHTQ